MRVVVNYTPTSSSIMQAYSSEYKLQCGFGRMKQQWIKNKWRKCTSKLIETWKVDKRTSFSSCVLCNGTVKWAKQACIHLLWIWKQKIILFVWKDIICAHFWNTLYSLVFVLSLLSYLSGYTFICFIFLGFWTVTIQMLIFFM